MKKFAIIALVALTVAPSAASAGWYDFTCVLFNRNCDRARPDTRPWWEDAADYWSPSA